MVAVSLMVWQLITPAPAAPVVVAPAVPVLPPAPASPEPPPALLALWPLPFSYSSSDRICAHAAVSSSTAQPPILHAPIVSADDTTFRRDGGDITRRPPE